MNFPKWVQTGQDCFHYLEGELKNCQERWRLFGLAMATAYSSAYDDQVKVLDGVKTRIEAKRAADEKFMTFALSLLTVGVGGPVAGGLVSRVVTKAGTAVAKSLAGESEIEAAVKFAEKMGEKAKEKVTEQIKSGTEKLAKYLSPEMGDPFKPVSDSPAKFGFKLLEEITRIGAVQEVLLSKLRNSPEITLAGATALAEKILGSSYYQDMPETSISDDQLKPRADLALWVAWALSRDDRYWIRASNQRASANQAAHNDPIWDEQFMWEPVRKKLVVDLKVPENQITVWGTENGWMNRTRNVSGLWMWGLMKWAASSQAYDMLFSGGVPTNADGLELVRQQWGERKLGPNGWIAVPQACYKPVDSPFGPLTLVGAR